MASSRSSESRKEGKQKVKEVVEQINASGIFLPDNGFLVRVALKESNYGTDPRTYTRPNVTQGIWQIDEIGFKDTQSGHSNLARIHAKIKEKFGIDWKQVKWTELNSNPLYGALAARIMLSNIPLAIPESLPHQAAYWKVFYNSVEGKGKPEDFMFAAMLDENDGVELGLLDVDIDVIQEALLAMHLPNDEEDLPAFAAEEAKNMDQLIQSLHSDISGQASALHSQFQAYCDNAKGEWDHYETHVWKGTFQVQSNNHRLVARKQAELDQKIEDLLRHGREKMQLEKAQAVNRMKQRLLRKMASDAKRSLSNVKTQEILNHLGSKLKTVSKIEIQKEKEKCCRELGEHCTKIYGDLLAKMNEGHG